MITEQALQEAIAECQGQRNPNASTCLKLAAYYTIQDKMYGDKKQERTVAESIIPSYSYSSGFGEQVDTVNYKSDTEFSKIVDGMSMDKFMPVMDELMTVLKTINPRLYNGVLRKFED